MPPPTTHKCLILKGFLLSTLVGLSFLASSLAFAFGGGGGGGTASPSARYKGVDSFGAHFGGSGQVEIEFTDCNDDKTSADYGLCTCLDPNAKYLIDAKKCVCKGGWKQEGKNCVFTCSGKEVDRCLEYDENCACISCQSGFSVVSGICAFTPNFSGNLTPPYENCLTFSNGTCTQCENGYYLQDTECVTSCSAGYYTKGTSCVQDCGVGYKVDGSACVACGTADINQKCGCGENKIWNGNSCECNDTSYPDGNGGCTACPNGALWTGEGTECYPCPKGQYSGYASNPDYPYCRSCSAPYPYFSTESACAACNYEGSPQKRRLLSNGQCVFQCKKGEFIFAGNGSCQSCSQNYAQSSMTEDNCYSCNYEGSEYPRKIVTNEYGQYCVRETCDKGYFKDNSENCRECSTTDTSQVSSPNDCAVCNYEGSKYPRKVVEQSDGTLSCVRETCDEGYFQDNSENCRECSTTDTSQVSSPNDCTVCNYKDSKYPRKVIETSYGELYCAIETCPNGYFQDSLGRCYQCSDYYTVDDVEEEQCNLCLGRKIVNTDQCVRCAKNEKCNCGDNMVANGNGGCMCDSNFIPDGNGGCKACGENQIADGDVCICDTSKNVVPDDNGGCKCNSTSIPDGNGGCKACGDNQIANSDVCVCDSNSFKPNYNTLTCVPCSSYSAYTVSPETDCNCSERTTIPADLQYAYRCILTECPTGFYRISDGGCVDCSINEGSFYASEEECQKCIDLGYDYIWRENGKYSLCIPRF